MGNPGYNIVKRNNKNLSYEGMYASEDKRLLTHDVLEHWDFNQNDGNLQELVAIGSILAHREEDFINNFTCKNSFAWEVAEQLYYALDNIDINRIKLPRSSNEYVSEYLSIKWNEVLRYWEEERQEAKPTNTRKIKAIAYHFLSRGYNHVKGINRRYGHFAFNSMFYDMQSVLEQGLKRVDAYEGSLVKLSYSFAQHDCYLSQVLYNIDEYGYETPYTEILSTMASAT
jgi:hypothetical protein